MSRSVTFDFNKAAFDGLLSELITDFKESTRPAAQAGAQVFYDRVVSNVARLGRNTGNLAASIYQAYSKDNSTDTRATYHIAWNHKKAPHGHLVEFGYLSRYVTYIGKDGKWYTAKQRTQKGTARKKPRGYRKMPQSKKDAIFVLRPDGPKQIPAQPFLRPALAMADEAARAVRLNILEALIRGNA